MSEWSFQKCRRLLEGAWDAIEVSPESHALLLDKKMVADFTLLIQSLLEKNRYINLTAVRDPESMVEKHLIDSLIPVARGWIAPEGKPFDLGAGAGFPGIPLALSRDAGSWCFIESIGKKADWLKEISRELNIAPCEIVEERAEILGQQAEYREKFSWGVARAVAAPTVTLELGMPLLQRGGEFWCWLGGEVKAEDLASALKELGGELQDILSYRLPSDESEKSERQIYRMIKKRTSPERYPRRVGIPKKRPL